MRMECLCGNGMSNAGLPNDVEHLLIENRLIDEQEFIEVEGQPKQPVINHCSGDWVDAGAIDVWKCRECSRLYLIPYNRDFEKIVVYKVERVGLP